MKELLVILGGGESGIGSALLAYKKGWDVFLSDKSQLKAEFKQELIDHKIPFEEGQHSLDKILNAKLVIKSPGIPDSIALIKML